MAQHNVQNLHIGALHAHAAHAAHSGNGVLHAVHGQALAGLEHPLLQAHLQTGKGALQRGGDQAVVKSETSVEYYGGRSKSVQKKTKVRSRVIAGELTGLIKNSGNVIVMGHKYADHDSIASCVAVSRMAKW